METESFILERLNDIQSAKKEEVSQDIQWNTYKKYYALNQISEWDSESDNVIYKHQFFVIEYKESLSCSVQVAHIKKDGVQKDENVSIFMDDSAAATLKVTDIQELFNIPSNKRKKRLLDLYEKTLLNGQNIAIQKIMNIYD